MATRDTARIAAQDDIRCLARRLDAAGHGGRTALVDEFGAMFGWSRNKVYGELKRVGWSSGRKKRADAGNTSQDKKALTELSAALRIGLRANGKAVMETPNARSLLAANGREFNVSNGRLNSLLKRYQMDLATQRRERPVTRQRSLHPNHVHEVDPSYCLLYYPPGGHQRIVDEAQFYKNKPENLEKISALRLWRYVLTDHASGTIIVRYYQAAGETTANLWDFLLYCWQQVSGRPFHGVPRILVWDKGSANASSAIKVALRALDVQQIPHEAGNARAKGQVENANNLVEKSFESRLRYQPVADVDELNAAAEAWTNAYNANRIPHYDSRLKRAGLPEPVARYELWQRIRQEQLRLLPDRELCQYLLTAEPKLRKIKNDLTVTFRHPNTRRTESYSVAHIPECFAGVKVAVSPLVYGGNQVIVAIEDYRGEQHSHVCDPLEYDDYGFEAGGAVIGEGYKSLPDTEIERRAKAADRSAYGDLSADDIKKAKAKQATPFNGLDAHAHLAKADIPSYMRRRGTDMDVPSTLQPEVKPLTVTAAARLLADALGRPITVDENADLRRRYPDGVPESAIEDLAAELSGEAIHRPGLRVAK